MSDLREALADEAHKAWSEWMEYLFKKCEHNEDGTCTIPEWAVKRWHRQMLANYDELPEDEKESDRKEAFRYMVTMLAYINELLKPW